MQIDSYVSDRRKKRKKRQGYVWGIAIFLAAYFICLGIFLFVVRSPVFQAQKITIEGNGVVSQADIMNLLEASIINHGAIMGGTHSGLKAFLGFRNMLIWPDALPSSTLAFIPQLAGVTISKDYFLRTITVTVAERQPFAVWCLMPAENTQGDEQCFWFDGEGTVFERTLDTQGNAIFVVHDYAQSKLALGGKVLPDKFVSNLLSIINVLRTSGLSIQTIALNDLLLQQIDVTTANGPAISFSLRFPSNDDLAVLKNIMAKPGFSKLQYIDFTVENRAYYK